MGEIVQSLLGTPAEREQRVKANVLQQLGVTNGNKIVLEVSSQTYEYNPEGDWKISELGTKPNEAGVPVTRAVLNEPL